MLQSSIIYSPTFDIKSKQPKDYRKMFEGKKKKEMLASLFYECLYFLFLQVFL
jgi:hypothetical protein